MRSYTTVLLAAALVAAVPSLASGGMRVAFGGRSRISVVLPANPKPLIREAAADLARCLGKAAGAAVPLVEREAEVKTPCAILVGDRRGVDTSGLGRDGCVIKTTGNRIRIAGATDVGVSSGVYTLLIEYVGARWFSSRPLDEVIPFNASLTLPRMNYRRRPDFRYRHLPGSSRKEFAAWGRRNRLEPYENGIAKFAFGHNLYTIITAARFGKTHPEYFAMLDGRRRVPPVDRWTSPNPCLSNPDVIRIAAEAAHAYFRKFPDRDTFPISINDSKEYCHCPVCEKMNAGLPPGQGGAASFSESYFYFVSEVAKRVLRTDPGKYLGCFPYWPVYPLPRRIDRLPGNVVIQLTQDSSQQHDPAYRSAERAQWIGWSRKVSSISRYDYYELGWLSPRSFPHLAASDLKFIKAHGCDGFFCAIAPAWCMLGPHLYVVSRLLWDVNLDPDALLKDYCDKLYGPAGKEMLDFYNNLEQYWMQPRPARWFEGVASGTGEFGTVNGPLIETAWHHLDRAEKILTSLANARAAARLPIGAGLTLEAQRLEDVRRHFLLPYLLIRMQAEARSLSTRRIQSRTQLSWLGDRILQDLRYMHAAKSVYVDQWEHDPDYNGSYYGSDTMHERLRDWSYEADRLLTLAVGNARHYVDSLPSPARDGVWDAFTNQLSAKPPLNLGTATPAPRTPTTGVSPNGTARAEIRLADGKDDPALDPGWLLRDFRADFDHSDAAIGKGYSDSSNKGGELAWSESYMLMAYMEMYRATLDRKYLRHLIAHFDRMLLHRDDVLGLADSYAGKPLSGWGSEGYSKGKWHVWIVHTGMILRGPAQFVRIVREQKFLQGEFGAKAAEYRARIVECLRDAEPYWRTGPESDEGYYVDPYLEQVLPLNQQNALGLVMLELTAQPSESTAEEALYRDRATRLAHFFHRRLRYTGSGVFDWAYWPKQTEDGPGSEDISHGGLNVWFAQRCAELGIVFSRRDVARIARAWLENVERPDGTYAGTVGGTGSGKDYMPYAVGFWLAGMPSLPPVTANIFYQSAVRAYGPSRFYGPSELVGLADLLRFAPAQ